MDSQFQAVYPTLYTQKGTPVRYYLEFSDGSNMLVEPLRTRAAGLVLNLKNISHYLDITGATTTHGVALLGVQGDVVSNTSLQQGVTVTRIEATVIYPNGRTWEGRLLEGVEAKTELMVWDWNLARALKLPDCSDIFGFNKPWQEVPTTVAFTENSIDPECGHAHACPKMCDAISKFL